ncbi:hypothetical protein DOE78_23220 [Bacillus sp. Y1]|nr:hypothetical protein DOE78_23220 [Bacillus sp. Y1]
MVHGILLSKRWRLFKFDKGSVNTNPVNELDIPITVIGVKAIIVESSPDGIFVVDISSSPKIKELISFYRAAK